MATWIKLHDNFTENPKVLAAGEDAAWLYVAGLLYCSRNLTDGRIPAAALARITAKKDARTLAAALVREGLWDVSEGGWEVHDYLEVQRSKEQVEGVREAGKIRAKRSREARAKPERTDTERSRTVRAIEAETEPDTTPPPPSRTPFARTETIDPAQVEKIRELKRTLHPHLVEASEIERKALA